MKNLKLIIFILMIALFSITNSLAMQYGELSSWRRQQVFHPVEGRIIEQKESQELKELEKRREQEKITMKPGIKVASISSLNQLMLQESDKARDALLNTLPRELKEYLVGLIDDRRQLLDRNQPDEAALVEDLNMLQKQIQQNLSQ